MKERVERLAKIMQCLTEIVASSNIKRLCPEAIERYEYLLRYGSVVYPIKEYGDISFKWTKPVSLMDYEGRRSEWWKDLKIYPMIQKDASMGPIAEYIAKTEFSAYGSSYHYIILNINSYETDWFLATAILHEIGHAQTAEKENRVFFKADRTNDKRVQEEMRLWEFDCQVMSSIGGKDFINTTDLCLDKIAHIAKNFPIATIRFGSGFGSPMDYCYGHCSDERAVKNRDTTYSIYCLFAMADRYIKDDSHRRDFKLRIIEKSYNNSFLKKEKDFAEAMKKTAS